MRRTALVLASALVCATTACGAPPTAAGGSSSGALGASQTAAAGASSAALTPTAAPTPSLFGSADRPEDDAKLEQILIEATKNINNRSTVTSAQEIRAKVAQLQSLAPTMAAQASAFASSVATILPQPAGSMAAAPGWDLKFTSSKPQCAPPDASYLQGVSFYLTAPTPAAGSSLTSASTPEGKIYAWIDPHPSTALTRSPNGWKLNIRDFVQQCAGNKLTITGAYGGTDEVTLAFSDDAIKATEPDAPGSKPLADGSDDYVQYEQDEMIRTLDPATGKLRMSSSWYEDTAIARVGNMVFVMKEVREATALQLAQWMSEIIKSARARA